jgi:hypothetical protein
MWKIRTLESLVDESLANQKFLVTLVGIFAGLALLLTWIGLYGVIRYLVDGRTPEIGIRDRSIPHPDHMARVLPAGAAGDDHRSDRVATRSCRRHAG